MLAPIDKSLALTGREANATEALYLQGLAHANLDNLDRAMALSRSGGDTTAIERQLVTSYNTKAGNLIQSEQAEEALEPLEKSLAVTQESAKSGTALYLRGVAYEQLDRLEESTESLELSLEVDENGSNALNAHRQLTNVYASLGELDKAAEHFQRSEELGES